MERKLAEYRARKSREETIKKGKEKLKTFFTFPGKYISAIDPVSKPPLNESTEEDEKLLLSQDQSEVESGTSELDDKINCCSYIDIFRYMVWFILWFTMYMIFIKLQFGTVFLICSALIFIYFNTRTRPKNANEISAYSVFNKNCESIDGTLKAEQFEKELYGR